MFMARLQLAVTAYNYIIRDGGFTSHLLALIPGVDPIFARYTTRDTKFVPLITHVDSSIVDSSRDMSFLISLQQTLNTKKKRKMTYNAEKELTVNHVGITMVHPLNQGLFCAQNSIFSAIGLFPTGIAPFLQFVIRIITLDSQVRQYVTEMLSIDTIAVKSSRGKLDYSANMMCNQIYASFSAYMRSKLKPTVSPRTVILHSDFQHLATDFKEKTLQDRLKVMKME
jgi:hypothetical protein